MPQVGVGVEELLLVEVVKVRMGCRRARGTFARCNRLRSMVVLVKAMRYYSQGGGRRLEPMLRYVYLIGW